MLDGLLNRGFSSKCKSLIKDVMKRLEVGRRRAEAKQRFWKEDLVKLLSNGHDINAYGRTEEFLAGLNLLSCYDFIAYTCEYIVKLLSIMQKQRECPEDCREAVASLMFAAARFSDLPELRDLRDLFQERYGSEMECFVNQKFLEKLSSLPPTAAKRLQLLQDLATEFSIKWDHKGFEQRMAGGSSTYTQVPSSVNGLNADGNGVISRKSDASPKPRHVGFDKEAHLLYHEKPERRGQEQLPLNPNEMAPRKKEQVPKRHEDRVDKYELSNNKDNIQSNMVKPCSSSSSKKRMDIAGTRYDVQSAGTCSIQEREKTKSSGYKVCVLRNEDVYSDKKHVEIQKEVDSLKANKHNVVLPPPYVKPTHNPIPPPYIKPNDGKHKATNSKPEDAISKRDGNSLNPSPHDRVGSANLKQHDLVYREDDKIPPLPRPRSVRKHKSFAQYNDDDSSNMEDGAVKRSSSSSRRKGNSKKGSQILFDDEKHGVDEEERIMDNLLLHYSKKSSPYDEAGKTRRRPESKPEVHVQHRATDIAESSSHEHRGKKSETISTSMRSISLPNEQKKDVTETTKSYNRVNSFQPDNRASHVHPKLPEYDDLAARFAALRGG